jgi:hypothetical protein
MADINPAAPIPNPFTENQFSVKQQPFSPALQPQAYISTGPQTVSGYGGRGEALAMFADKFLQGFSRGRALSVARQEQERGQLQKNVDDAIQFVQQSDATPDVKNKMIGQLYGTKLASMKVAVDQSKDKDNPQLKAIKHAFDAMLGPTKKKYEFGPEQINATIAQAYRAVTTPQNTVAGASASVNDQVQKYISQKYAEKNPTPDVLQNDPNLRPYFNLQAYRGLKLPALDQAMAQAQATQKEAYTERQISEKAANTPYALKKQDDIRLALEKNPGLRDTLDPDQPVPESVAVLGAQIRKAGMATPKMVHMPVEVTGPDGKKQFIEAQFDLNSPQKAPINMATGQEMPFGSYKTVNVSLYRADMWGVAGNLMRLVAWQHPEWSDAKVKDEAGKLGQKQFNLQIQGKQLDILADQVNLGDRSNLSSPGPPPEDFYPQTGSAKPPGAGKTGPPVKGGTPAPPKIPGVDRPLTDQEETKVSRYYQYLTEKAPNKYTQAGAQQGHDIVLRQAKALGISAPQFEAMARTWVSEGKSLPDTVNRYFALTRVINSIDLLNNQMIEPTVSKLLQTGSPWLTRRLRDAQLATVDDPNLRAFNVFLNEVQRQYGVISSGGTLSRAQLPVSTTENVQHIIDGSATVGGVLATTKAIRDSGVLDKQAMEKTIQETQQGMAGGVTGAGTMTGAPPAKPGTTAPPQKAAPAQVLPKPQTAGQTANDDVLKQYLDANGGDINKAAAAMRAAGWK